MMTYREKLEKYKRKQLPEDEMAEVRDEIEKVDAISEYLAEQLEEELNFGGGRAGSDAELNDVSDDREASGNRKHEEDKSVSGNVGRSSSKNQQELFDKEAESFEKYVKKSIRKAYVRMSLGIGAVLLAVLLFLQFGLSPLMDSIYYNPARQEKIDTGTEEKQTAVVYHPMTMDYGIYAELSLPCKNEVSVMAYPQGFGNYSISITPVVSYGTGDSRSVAGQIRKGKLELYDPKYLQRVPPNFFLCYALNPVVDDSGEDYVQQMERASEETFTDEDGREYRSQSWFYDSLESAEKAVEELDENRKYLAYVSFRRDLNFAETGALMEELLENQVDFIAQPWIAFRNEEDNYFRFGVSGYNYRYGSFNGVPAELNRKYPYLGLFDMEDSYEVWDDQEFITNEEIMTQHVESMCRYMGDNDDFVEMLDYSNASYTPGQGRFRGYADYVKEHGLSSYGFVCITTRADMLNMLENEEIAAIVPRDWE